MGIKEKGKPICLIVDDEFLILENLKLLLEEMNYKVVTSTSYRKILTDYAKEDIMSFSFIISDINLKNGENGIEFYEFLHEMNYKKVILMSGYEGLLIDKPFLKKPFVMKELKAEITKLYDKLVNR